MTICYQYQFRVPRKWAVEFHFKTPKVVYKKVLDLPNDHKLLILAKGEEKMVNFKVQNKGATAIHLRNFSLPEYEVSIPLLTLDPYESDTFCLLSKHLERANGQVLYSFDLDEDGSKKSLIFMKNIAEMQDDKESADAVLSCDGTKVYCHIAILVARSKGFRDMFGRKSFMDDKAKRITIKDMPLATLNEMIKFIYSNKFNAGEDTDLSSLLSAAHLYDIPDLLSQCERLMMSKITTDNAAEFFHQGFLTNSNGLKKAAMNFILKNFETVQRSDGWKLMKEDGNVNLLLEDILSHVNIGEKVVVPSSSSSAVTHGRDITFLSNFSAMHNDLDFTDVVLCCERTNVFSHIPILMARSHYFRISFFQREFVFGSMKVVKITNISLATLKGMVQFIYTNTFNTKDTDISALFTAAHFYGIPSLVTECSKVMKRTLTIQNAAEFFFKGFSTRSKDLKEAALTFISKSFLQVRKTNGWKLIMQEETAKEALEEILIFFATKHEDF